MNPNGDHDDLSRIIDAYKELNKYGNKNELMKSLVNDRFETLFDNTVLDSDLIELSHINLTKDMRNPRSIRSVVGKMKSLNRSVVVQSDIRLTVMKSLIRMYDLNS